MLFKIIVIILGLVLLLGSIFNIEGIYRTMRIKLLFFRIQNLKVARALSFIIGGALVVLGIMSLSK